MYIGKLVIEKRETWIDSLKGLAIVGIVLIHTGAGNQLGIVGTIGKMGRYGVQLLFLISAFLTFNLMKRQLMKNSHGENT